MRWESQWQQFLPNTNSSSVIIPSPSKSKSLKIALALSGALTWTISVLSYLMLNFNPPLQHPPCHRELRQSPPSPSALSTPSRLCRTSKGRVQNSETHLKTLSPFLDVWDHLEPFPWRPILTSLQETHWRSCLWPTWTPETRNTSEFSLQEIKIQNLHLKVDGSVPIFIKNSENLLHKVFSVSLGKNHRVHF